MTRSSIPSSFVVPTIHRQPRESVNRRIAAALDEAGVVVVEDFVTPAQRAALRRGALRRWGAAGYAEARIGARHSAVLHPEIRTDRICWLDEESAQRAERRYLSRLESLRRRLNRELYLGLVDWEGHLAVYPEGGFYRRHLDRFRQDDRRAVSTVLYLNEGWKPDHGGALRLWASGADDAPFVDVAPIAGRLVSFLSADLHHEVLPSRAERMSITGWFRTR